MIYHQNILKREDKELVMRIYKAQVENPSPGDMIELLKNDFSIIEEELNETAIANTSTNSFKKFINKKIRLAAFKYLVELKESHSKVRSIEYNKLETQRYLTSPIFSNEDVALRSRALNCKANFKNKYKETDTLCPLCSREEDTQQHMMVC